MSTSIYKVCANAEWLAAVASGRYSGSADDRRDKFIHLSTAAQLEGTLARHFAGQADLVLIAFDSGMLGDALKWESSRGGALFPHVYGPLATDLAVSVEPLALGTDGRHKLRAELA